MNKLLPFELARKNPAMLILLLQSVVITCLWLNARSDDSRQTTVSLETTRPHPAPWSRAGKGAADQRASPSPAIAALEPTASVARMDWSALESDDFATYVANLRASGCPEETVRRIVTAEVREAFDLERVKQLDEENIPFWDAGYNAHESASPEFEKLAADEMALLSSRLGPEALPNAGDASGRIPTTWRFGATLAGKREEVTGILARADAQREELLASLGDAELSPNHEEMFARIEAEKAAALAATLTDDEQFDFEIRNSPIADELRALLQSEGRQANESQFREMFRARKVLASRIHEAALSGVDCSDAWTHYQSEVQRVLQGLPAQES